MAHYTGTTAARIVEIKRSSLSSSKKEGKLTQLLEDQLSKASNTTAGKAAEEISESTLKALTEKAKPPADKSIDQIIGDTKAILIESANKQITKENEALLVNYREILLANAHVRSREPDKIIFADGSTEFLDSALDKKLLNYGESETKQVIDALDQIKRIGKEMDGKLTFSKAQIDDLSAINPHLLAISVADANAGRKRYKNEKNEEPETNADLFEFLISQLRESKEDDDKKQLRQEIHAIALHEVKENLSRNPDQAEGETLPTLFQKMLTHLRTQGLDEDKTELEQKTSRENMSSIEQWRSELDTTKKMLEEKQKELTEAQKATPPVPETVERLKTEVTTLQDKTNNPEYDALIFMKKAIDVAQKLHPHDANKAPTTLEILHKKLTTIHDSMTRLQIKAQETQKPSDVTQLEYQARDNVLREYGELANMLKDQRYREALQASFKDDASHEEFMHYLQTLEKQQVALINMAGKNERNPAQIDHTMFITDEAARTGFIQKQNEAYGAVSYKERDADGNWKTQELKSKKYGTVTGLSLEEIIAAIKDTEIKLGIKIDYKVINDSVKYDAHSQSNRTQLHEAFIARYENKMEKKAKDEVSAKNEDTKVNHQEAGKNDTTSVTHTFVPAEATGTPVKLDENELEHDTSTPFKKE